MHGLQCHFNSAIHDDNWLGVFWLSIWNVVISNSNVGIEAWPFNFSCAFIIIQHTVTRSTTEIIKQQQLGPHLGLCVTGTTTDAGEPLIITGTTKLYPEQIWDLALSHCHSYLQRLIEMQSKIILDKHAYHESPWASFNTFFPSLVLFFQQITILFWCFKNVVQHPHTENQIDSKIWVLLAESAPLSIDTMISLIKQKQSEISEGKVKQLPLPQFYVFKINATAQQHW